MSQDDKDNREGQYWICDDCAKAKGWTTHYPFGGNTVIRGLCGHCEREDEAFLAPTCDFNKPGEKALWD